MEVIELTTQGYDNIIDRIVNRIVKPPEELTANELCIWCNAYAECQDNIIDIINKLKEGYGR